MLAFLSPAWIEELDAAAVAVDPGVTFDLDLVVTGTPDGDLRYRLSLAHGRARVRMTSADAAPAGATLTLSYAAARDLATGRRNGSEAFDAGLVRFRGDLGRLQAATAALAAVAEGLAVLRPRTTFGPPNAS